MTTFNQDRLTQLSKGDVAIDYREEKDLELLKKVLKDAFPEDEGKVEGDMNFYQMSWKRFYSGYFQISIPAHPLSWFLSTPYIEPVKQEKETFKVRVTKDSGNHESWIADYIGQVFEVYTDREDLTPKYHLLEDKGKGTRRFLWPSDCEIISEPIDGEVKENDPLWNFLVEEWCRVSALICENKYEIERLETIKKYLEAAKQCHIEKQDLPD